MSMSPANSLEAATAHAPRPLQEFIAEFPIKERYAFFNHAGVAPIPLSAQYAIGEFARAAAEEGPANYQAWLHGMATTRALSQQLLNAPSQDDIAFIHNTTHGLIIVANSINWQAGDNIVSFDHEFPANVMPWKNLAERGVELRLSPERADHTYDLDHLESLIDARTRLVSVSWVEYATGVRNDIARVAEICKRHNVLFCLDAIQGLGIVPMDVEALGVDFLMADGHKWLLGPEGCGLLYVRREIIPQLNHSMLGWCGLRNPQDYGNTDQPYKPDARRFEEGSHNLMSIIAMGASIKLLLDAGIERVQERIAGLTRHLMDGARAKGYTVENPDDDNQRAGIVALTKTGFDPAEMMGRLHREHCILVAARRGYLRVSPHFYNDESEIDRLLAQL